VIRVQVREVVKIRSLKHWWLTQKNQFWAKER